MSQNGNHLVVKGAYGIMHFFGSATRTVVEGFYFFAPFMRPKVQIPQKAQVRSEQKIDFNEDSKKRLQIMKDIRDRVEKLKETRESITKETKVEIKNGPAPAAESKIEPKPESKPKPEPVENDAPKFKPPAVGNNNLLSGVEFESNLEKLQAEIYLKDFVSQDPDIRSDAVLGLKKLSPATTIKILMNIIAGCKSEACLIEAITALSTVNDESAVDKSIFKAHLADRNSGVRLASIRAISKYRDDEAFCILTDSLNDTDHEIRRQSLTLMCWTYGERAIPFAVKMLRDKEKSVRRTAVHVSGTLKAWQAVSSLISFLSDTDTDIQKETSEALWKITGKRFGFKTSGTKKEKNESIEEWRFWWRDNQSKYMKSDASKGHYITAHN